MGGGGVGVCMDLLTLSLQLTLKFNFMIKLNNTLFQVPAVLPQFIQCCLSEENIALC